MNSWHDVFAFLKNNKLNHGTIERGGCLHVLIMLALGGEETVSGLNKLRRPTFRFEETGALYEGAKVIEIARQGYWSARIGRFPSDSTYARTNAGCTIFAPLGQGAGIKFTEFDIIGNVYDFSSHRGWRIGPARSRTIEIQDFQCCTDYYKPVHISGKNSEVEFIMIEGPAQHSLVYGFDLATGEFAYSANADSAVSSASFFIELVHTAIRDPEVASALLDEERSALAGHLVRRSRDKLIHDASLWRLIQTVGVLDKKQVFELLGTACNHPNSEIATRASNILNQIAEMDSTNASH